MRDQVPEIKRRIRFFRLEVPVPDDGEAPAPLNFRQRCRDIAALDYAAGEHYEERTDGDLIGVWPEPDETQTDDTVALTFGRTQRYGMPRLEGMGHFRDIRALEREGVFQASHIVLFKEHDWQWTCAAESFRGGPSPLWLKDYFRAKGEGLDRLVQRPLFAPDAEALLQRFFGLKLFAMRLGREYLPTLGERLPNMAEGARSMLDESDAGRVEIILRTKPYAKDVLRGDVIDAIPHLLQRATEGLTAWRVEGVPRGGGSPEPVDLLGDAIMTQATMVAQDQRSRQVLPESAFEAVRAAYGEMRDLIRGALAVELEQ